MQKTIKWREYHWLTKHLVTEVAVADSYLAVVGREKLLHEQITLKGRYIKGVRDFGPGPFGRRPFR